MLRELRDGAVGQFTRSHGGGIGLVRVYDGVVIVLLDGACHRYPAVASRCTDAKNVNRAGGIRGRRC
jgi:Fe-S cluster biogenesis protein NfuA